MSKPLTITQFFKQYPDDEVCLAHLFEIRFGQGFACPKCERPSKWFRIKAERAYSCQWCGHHLHPTVGTPFEQTRTPLQYWFYAMYLFTTTRHGVPAMELQRQLGVTYKTAWRMGHEIRKHMADVDGDHPIGGPGEIVQIDETLVGGSVSGKGNGYKGNKTAIVGMMEEGGDVVTAVVKSRRRDPMLAVIHENVLPGTTIHTDEFGSYRDLKHCGFNHETVNHKSGQYVAKSGATVNAMESYWSQLKRGINGTHVSVSSQHLEKYAKEFEFRFNRRDRAETMFSELLSSFGPLSEGRD